MKTHPHFRTLFYNFKSKTHWLLHWPDFRLMNMSRWSFIQTALITLCNVFACRMSNLAEGRNNICKPKRTTYWILTGCLEMFLAFFFSPCDCYHLESQVTFLWQIGVLFFSPWWSGHPEFLWSTSENSWFSLHSQCKFSVISLFGRRSSFSSPRWSLRSILELKSRAVTTDYPDL